MERTSASGSRREALKPTPEPPRYFMPYQDLGDHHGLSGAQLTEATSEPCEGRHRVIVYPDFVTPTMSACWSRAHSVGPFVGRSRAKRS